MNSGRLSGRLSCAISALSLFLWLGFLIPIAVKSSGVILPIVGKSYPAPTNNGKYSSYCKSTSHAWIISWSYKSRSKLISLTIIRQEKPKRNIPPILCFINVKKCFLFTNKSIFFFLVMLKAWFVKQSIEKIHFFQILSRIYLREPLDGSFAQFCLAPIQSSKNLRNILDYLKSL